MDIAAGASHSLVLFSNGTVFAWGANYRGVLNVPPGLTNVVAVAAGEYHCLALLRDASVVAWGTNWGAEIVPTGLRDVRMVRGGGDFSVALTAPLWIKSIAKSIGGPTVHFRTFKGRQYILEHSSMINVVNWSTSGNALDGTGNDGFLTDTNYFQPTTRFYRVKESIVP
jgi:hypothetical protein